MVLGTTWSVFLVQFASVSVLLVVELGPYVLTVLKLELAQKKIVQLILKLNRVNYQLQLD
jgi:hypothetical protein